MTNEDVLLSAFTGLETAHFFSAHCPSDPTIAHFGAEPGFMAGMQRGLAKASLEGLALGIIVSLLIKNSMPFIFTIAVIVIMNIAYRHAMTYADQSPNGEGRLGSLGGAY